MRPTRLVVLPLCNKIQIQCGLPRRGLGERGYRLRLTLFQIAFLPKLNFQFVCPCRTQHTKVWKLEKRLANLVQWLYTNFSS